MEMSLHTKLNLVPADLKKFSFTGGCLKRAVDVNRAVTIPAVLKYWEETGRIDAIKLQWKEGMPNKPHMYWDSDVVKWIEAAAFSLAAHPDKKLEAKAEEIAGLFAKSQSPDGYIHSYFNGVAPELRWKNLRDNHELYSAGHLFEAAAELYRATGSRTLLDPALKFAKYIGEIFGKEPGKRRGCCGHEEIELALIKLYRTTGEKSLLEMAKYFIDERGSKPNCFAVERGMDDRTYNQLPLDYYQAHKPVREQDEAVGHAVRAGYLYTGMADVAAETGDDALLAACEKLWDSVTLRKMYITGGVGSMPNGETFTGDYDLPNAEAYSETCAAIALFLFADRMRIIKPDSKYADVMELALYNTIMAGVSHEGDAFFYANRLSCEPERMRHERGIHYFPAKRQKGFSCSCCPPNVARIFASLGQYVYSVSESEIYAHLFADCDFTANVFGEDVLVSQRTAYPYDGKIEFSFKSEKPSGFTMAVRIPGWAGSYSAKLNGKELKGYKPERGYLKINRKWENGEKLTFDFEMPPLAVEAHPSVGRDCGRIALKRGPVVYCVEEADNGKGVEDIAIDLSKPLKVKMDKKFFGGVPVIEASGLRRETKGWENTLYRPFGSSKTRPVKIKAVPYHLWANRGEGEMAVWIRNI
jgi:DUF1680 family protein